MPGLYRSRRRSRGPTLGGSFDLRIQGAEKLGDVAKQLRQVGDKELKKETYRGLRSAAKPLIADTREFARRVLPEEGHLNERVARSRFRVRVRTGRDPGVSITATGLDKRLDTQGRLRHPTFGRRGRDDWKEQKVNPGWFHIPMRRGTPKVQRELVKVLDRVSKKLEVK